MNNRTVIIVAAGSGKRLKHPIPKQFLELKGKPVIMHTAEAFYKYDPQMEFIIVLASDKVAFWNDLKKKHAFQIPHKIAIGGATRFHSVKNGLQKVEKGNIVAVHDAARPFVSQDTIKQCFNTAEKEGNCIPTLDIAESVRMANGNTNTSINRLDIKIVQTPQIAKLEIFKKAFLQDYQPEFTDEAKVLENAGYKINIIQGNQENIKITTPFDWKIAMAIIDN
jgi:2-C-methyl-D-erythritol 4-phosphate cytidylyltransferase